MNQPAPRRPVLKSIDAVDDAAGFAGFGPDAVAKVDDNFASEIDYSKDDPKTLVKRSRAQAQVVLDGLTAQKAAAEARIAAAEKAKRDRLDAANKAFEAENADAKAKYDAAMADIQADLDQLSACKEGFDLLVARLNRAAE